MAANGISTCAGDGAHRGLLRTAHVHQLQAGLEPAQFGELLDGQSRTGRHQIWPQCENLCEVAQLTDDSVVAHAGQPDFAFLRQGNIANQHNVAVW